MTRTRSQEKLQLNGPLIWTRNGLVLSDRKLLLRKKLKVGDTGSELLPELRGISMIPGIGEAECEALSNDVTLRELVQLWSTLDLSVQRAILTIARQSK